MKKDYPHQVEILEKSKEINNLAMFWEMGCGKSKATVDILRNIYNTRKAILPTLILSPIVTLYNWKNEFELWSQIDPGIIHVIDCNGAKRVKLLTKILDLNPNCIIIINYEAVQTKAVYEIIKNWTPMIVVADEMHKLKNHKSKRAKKIIDISDNAVYRYGLTGTPILNNITDVFNQYRFLDAGKTFGRNYWVFQNKYMYDANASWSHQPNHFPDLKPRPESFQELNEKMYRIATRVTKEEAMPFLPPLIKTKRHVQLGKDQARHYKNMKNEFITYVEGLRDSGEPEAVVAQLAMTKALRLQQIVSGFLSTENGEIIPIDDNPRIAETKIITEEIVSAGNKVILWCCFKHDYDQLSKMCDELGYNYKMIIGGMSLEEKQKSINEFSADENCQVVIANRRAGGIGINLVSAAYSVVYSRNFSLEDELQSEARNHRGGSQIHEKIFKIDMVAKDTIDEAVLEALSNKEKLSSNIIDMV